MILKVTILYLKTKKEDMYNVFLLNQSILKITLKYLLLKQTDIINTLNVQNVFNWLSLPSFIYKKSAIEEKPLNLKKKKIYALKHTTLT